MYKPIMANEHESELSSLKEGDAIAIIHQEEPDVCIMVSTVRSIDLESGLISVDGLSGHFDLHGHGIMTIHKTTFIEPEIIGQNGDVLRNKVVHENTEEIAPVFRIRRLRQTDINMPACP